MTTYTVLICTKPPSSTQPGHPSMGECKEYQWKTALCNGSI